MNIVIVGGALSCYTQKGIRPCLLLGGKFTAS